MKTVWKYEKLSICGAGFLITALLGVRHLSDVKAGAIESGDYWLITRYLILAVCVLAFVVLSGYLICWRNEWKIEQVFLLCGTVLGALYMSVLPPLSAPDEVSHYITAYQLSNHMMGVPVMNEKGRINIRQEDAFIEDVYHVQESGEEDAKKRVVLGGTLMENTYKVIHDRGLFGLTEEGTTISNIFNVQTTPMAYVPQAIGITLARLFRMSGIGLLFMGRLFNLLFYVGMVYLAMKKLPFGKELLFGVSMLPMTLNLMSSMSYDVMIMALSFYFTAYVLNLAYKADHVRKRDVAVLALLVAVLMPCKMVYVVLMGLCFLIPVRKFGGWKPYLISAVLIFGAFAAAMVLVNSQVISTYVAEVDSYVPWAGEAGYNLSQLLHSPRLILSMFYNTIVWQSDHYYLTMMGAYLGNIDEILEVPFLVISGFTVALCGLTFRKPGETIHIAKGQRLWIGFLGLACFGITLFSMLLAWTPVSSKIISGVQGRYFLPILPVLLMALKNNTVVLTKNLDRILLYMMCCANGYVLLRLFGIVSMRL